VQPTTTPEPAQDKLCPRCERTLPLDAFNRHRYGRLGRRSWCRECEAAARPKRRRTVPEGKRWCPRCERELELSCFGRNRARGGGGLRAWCRECEAEHKRDERASVAGERLADRVERAERVKETGLKTCGRCGDEKPVDAFRPRKDSLDGYRNLCRDCEKARAMEPDPEDRERFDRWQQRKDDFELLVEKVRRKLVKDGIVED